jgi:hypothetical protein
LVCDTLNRFRKIATRCRYARAGEDYPCDDTNQNSFPTRTPGSAFIEGHDRRISNWKLLVCSRTKHRKGLRLARKFRWQCAGSCSGKNLGDSRIAGRRIGWIDMTRQHPLSGVVIKIAGS